MKAQPKIEIREATQRELYSITAMTRDFFPYTGFTFDTIVERMQNPDIQYFVALADGHSVGFVDVEMQTDGSAKILGLAVLKEWRNKGIGKLLLEKALEVAMENKAKSVVMLVAEDNDIAQKLYEQSGFKKTGVLNRKLWGKTVLLYSRKL
ncbi:MAG: N-acetyltransferase [Candidatus Micrarchaeota archaeon]